MQRIVGSIVQSAALLALQCPTSNQVCHVDDIAQFADVTGGMDALEESLSFLIKHIEAVPCTMQAKVRAHDTYIVGHDEVDLLDALGNKHFLFVGHCAFIVPLGHTFVPVVPIDMLKRVLGSGIGIHHGLDE